MSHSYPKYIVATRTVTYDVARISGELSELYDEPVQYQEVIDTILDWARDDLSCGHGHTIDVDDFDWKEINEEA